jgi:preprotein translocase subunit SecF
VKIRRAIDVFRGEHELHVDIVGRRRLWFLLSGAAVLISIVALLGPALNLSIDFRGGSVLEAPNESNVGVEEVQEAFQAAGYEGAVVQARQTLEGEEFITVRLEALEGDRGEALDTLAEVTGGEVSEETVGPEWGQQISNKALQGLIIFLVAVTIYLSFRFEWKMAVAGIAAVFHDVIITAGVYALLGQEVTPETVIAVLTILGYSLYDTVVIFDRIKENAAQTSIVQRMTYAGMVNVSMNQVLMRSFNTTLTTLFPVVALMLFGGETLQSFAFALFVGLLLGAYSSVFLAAPLVAVLKEREPRMTEIRERAARRQARPGLRPVPADGPADGSEDGERELVRATAPRPASRPSAAARRKPKKKPRSKRKRR